MGVVVSGVGVPRKCKGGWNILRSKFEKLVEGCNFLSIKYEKSHDSQKNKTSYSKK